LKLIAPTDPLSHSADLTAENIDRLRELFPQAVTEDGGGKRIDFDVLRELLGGELATGDEKYGLNWHGKRAARRLALTPSTGTLRPAPEDSVDWDTTQNLMIEGDNLEVLKLLQKSYAGKIKMIYIDPPYNTGKDFVYKDDFRDSIGNYQRITGQRDADGAKLTSNAESSGRFHTDWLNMLYPRLMLARNLLRDDGVIYVSCDDSEVDNLRIIADTIFGEEQFVAQIVWQRSKKGDAKWIATVHEYILCYVRDRQASLRDGDWRRPKEGADAVLLKYDEFAAARHSDHDLIRQDMLAWFRELDDSDPRKAHKHYNWSDDRGLYFPDNFAGPDDGRESRPRHDIFHPVTGLSCKKPSTGWRWDEAKTKWALEQTPPRIHFGTDEQTIPNRKSYLREISSEPFSSVFYRDGRSATLEVEGLVGKGVFAFPKNTDVLRELIELATSTNDLILDFFAGSGSTGHAVMDLSISQPRNRKFILVQLPEPIDVNPFKTIAEVTEERLRRAAAKLKVDHPLFHGDLGFRVFKLDTTSIRPWDPTLPVTEQRLLGEVENILPGRTEQDLLYELLLKRGLELTVPLVERTLAGKQVFAVSTGDLIACLAPHIESADVEALAEGIVTWHKELAPPPSVVPNAPLEKPAKFDPPLVVFRDTAFADDVAKSNLTEILKQHNLTDVRSL
jgi:adenine-specific DNA-methyltransferase